MDPKGQLLLKLLFNEGETVCVSNNEFGFHSIPLERALNTVQITLESPNPKSPVNICDSRDFILVAINPIKGWRRDENVTAFRSYLIEMDIGSIKEQIGTITHLGIPFSAQVFSGNKSVHTVITLDEGLPDEKTYRSIGDWIFNIVSLADKNCRNPSRSIRIPGAYRDGGKKQRLIKIGKRISHKELFDWLNKYKSLQPKAKEKRVIPEGQADFSRLSPWACGMLGKGIETTRLGRNQTWYALAVDFGFAGYTEDQAIEILRKYFEEERDFKEKEWLTTIASAFKKVGEGR